jgi:hypothetical protein
MFNPTNPNEYIGKQLILNSDRIIVNSKEDNLLFSDKGFSFSTNGEFHFNTGDNENNKFVINAPKIHIGLENSALANNPAVKGNELREILDELISIIDNLYKIDLLLLNPIAPPSGPCAPDPSFTSKTQASQTRLSNLKNRLVEFQSNRVYLT